MFAFAGNSKTAEFSNFFTFDFINGFFAFQFPVKLLLLILICFRGVLSFQKLHVNEYLADQCFFGILVGAAVGSAVAPIYPNDRLVEGLNDQVVLFVENVAREIQALVVIWIAVVMGRVRNIEGWCFSLLAGLVIVGITMVWEGGLTGENWLKHVEGIWTDGIRNMNAFEKQFVKT